MGDFGLSATLVVVLVLVVLVLMLVLMLVVVVQAEGGRLRAVGDAGSWQALQPCRHPVCSYLPPCLPPYLAP